MDEYLGIVKIFAGTFAPRGWAFCQGQLLGIQQNAALFSLLGTTYGGNGQTTFGLPDLRGRIPVGQGQGAGLPNVVIGEVAGTPTVTLTIANMPAHNHALVGAVQLPVSADSGTTDGPSGNFLAQAGSNIFSGAATDGEYAGNLKNTLAVGANGSSTAFSIASPYLGVNYIICLQGLFPSRD